MKKITLIICAALGLGFSAMAQENFTPGSEIGLRGGVGYTIGETKTVKQLLAGAAAFDYGYRFTPAFTLRAGLSGWEGRAVYSQVGEGYNWRWGVNYVQLAVDAKFNVINIFNKNYSRLLNPYVFAGAGAQYRYNNGAKENYVPDVDFFNSFKKFSYVLRWGVGLDFKVCNCFKIGLELADNLTDDTFNSKPGSFFDSKFDLLLGFTYAFGYSGKGAQAASAATAATAAAAAAEVLAQTPAKEEPVKKEEPAPVVKEVAAQPKAEESVEVLNVYYVIGKSNILKPEASKVDAAVKALKADDACKAKVSGYADKETGNATLNMELSRSRATAVAQKLIENGIAPEKIATYWYGDTQKVSEKQEENRVTIIEIVK